MITRNELKYYSSLKEKKYRRLEGRFIAEGEKNVFEGLNSKIKCERIFCTNKYKEDNYEFFFNAKKKYFIETLSNPDFIKLTTTINPQEIAAVFLIPKTEFDTQKKHADTLIYLENISDPGNLGTIIRTCDWFGFNEILLNENCADIFNPKTIRSTAGSIFHVNIFERINLSSIFNELKMQNYKIITADTEGDDIFSCELNGKHLLVFCNEAKGPSKELLKITNQKITIPKSGKAESLNVASAAAIILSHWKRKK
jgi:TrmH family RNA methyltransferase